MSWINKGLQGHGTQKQHLVGLWVQFSLTMDTLLFCLYQLFTVIMIIVLWSTPADVHPQTQVWSPCHLWKWALMPIQIPASQSGQPLCFQPSLQTWLDSYGFVLAHMPPVPLSPSVSPA